MGILGGFTTGPVCAAGGVGNGGGAPEVVGARPDGIPEWPAPVVVARNPGGAEEG